MARKVIALIPAVAFVLAWSQLMGTDKVETFIGSGLAVAVFLFAARRLEKRGI